ncbi:unnamed protein product [Rhizoctonia solani]|uniref:G domain-containing protein n=1 Tax=Rhizoctonia solani TaxID=456999 RepID=A0A8H3HBM7_9AGAM|nr:unnamed protein product [Rhizoctonia solani]
MAANSTKPQSEVVSIPILILGAQGCGKSTLINAAFSEPVREISNGYELATKEFHFHILQASTHRFILVDSPGFDNTSMSDGEILAKLIRFLCCGKTPAKMAGVIYLHAQGAHLGSGVLRRNLSLIKTLLGDSFMERLTILLVPQPGQQKDHQELIRPLLDPKSPFYPLYDSNARVDVSVLETEPIRKVLLSYVGKAPVLVRVQDELCRSGRVPHDNDINFYLTKCARAKQGAATVTKPKPMAVSVPPSQTRQAVSTQHSSNEIKKLQLQLEESKKQKEDFSTQLQKHLSQYAALCSQLQLHENVEQSEIIQNLVDLNRHIEDIALSLSQHLVDTYAGRNMTTTRQAFQLSELKQLFEHEEGKTSLVQSSTGAGMPLEDFLDVAIRSILCEQIYKRIFAPFHPGLVLSEPRNGYTAALYSQIREKESQATLGRWRTASFAAISQMIGESELPHLKSKVSTEILNDNLMPMLRYLFGPRKNAQLKDAHIKDLSELVTQAWDWCVMLKEKIVLLGDFQPTAYRYGRVFDQAIMSEFEPRRGGPPPGRILSTIGLGLNVFHAQSSGEALGQVILSKASVVTEGWFERP